MSSRKNALLRDEERLLTFLRLQNNLLKRFALNREAVIDKGFKKFLSNITLVEENVPTGEKIV